MNKEWNDNETIFHSCTFFYLCKYFCHSFSIFHIFLLLVPISGSIRCYIHRKTHLTILENTKRLLPIYSVIGKKTSELKNRKWDKSTFSMWNEKRLMDFPLELPFFIYTFSTKNEILKCFWFWFRIPFFTLFLYFFFGVCISKEQRNLRENWTQWYKKTGSNHRVC